MPKIYDSNGTAIGFRISNEPKQELLPDSKALDAKAIAAAARRSKGAKKAAKTRGKTAATQAKAANKSLNANISPKQFDEYGIALPATARTEI